MKWQHGESMLHFGVLNWDGLWISFTKWLLALFSLFVTFHFFCTLIHHGFIVFGNWREFLGFPILWAINASFYFWLFYYGSKSMHSLWFSSYTPGSWVENVGGMTVSDYNVPKTTTLLLIGPKGSGKSSLINRISRVFEDDKFAPERAQVTCTLYSFTYNPGNTCIIFNFWDEVNILVCFR